MVRIAIIAIVLAFSNISQAWAAAPNIQVWYNYSGANPDIAFGLPGRTQTWVNVIGNVQSDVGIASLTYNINGGTEQTLVLGPNGRRLVELGDFNVEVDPTDPADPFFAGANFVNLKATDNNGVVATKTVTVDYEPGHVWPYPHTVDWQSTTIQDVESIAHIVDGKWQITANGIRTIQTGYDRTIAIGDRTWSTNDVSVTVPFILHSDFKGIGFGMGWQGHSGFVKPRKGWAGTYAWVRGPLSNPELDIMLYDPVEWEVVLASKPVSIALNTPYLLKSYAQPVDSTTSYFCIKFWPQGSSEPAAWDLCSAVPYRDGAVLLAANSADATFGNVNIGPLSTTPPPIDTTAPVISNVQASPTSTGATITWTTNEASDSAVDYGPNTSYGSTANNASAVTSHSVSLTGLASGTTYQYRVRSKDASNNTGSSSNLTFTTGAFVGGASGMVSDGFNSSSLNAALWTVRNPKGDGTVSTNGSQLVLSVPAGSKHDLWLNDEVLAVAQDVPNNTDFIVDVQFDSPVTTAYQTQGIRVKGTTGYIRSEFHHDGTTVRAYAATIINGTRTQRISKAITLSAPMYIRLARAGDLWTMQYSANGTNWTTAGTFSQAFTPTEAGPYAGNNGSSPPPHTAVVDNFIVDGIPPAPPPVDTTAPVISNVQASPTSTGATITWATNEASDSAVDYGTTTSYGSTANNASAVTSHSVSLTGLASGTTYQYRVRSKDASNNTGSSSNLTFTTGAFVGGASGMVSDGFNSSSLNAALWTVRNPKGDGTVSTNGSQLVLSIPGGTAHDLWLSDEVLAVAQDVPNNTDFIVDVQFDSPVTTAYQTQGIRVKGTTGYIRSEFHHDGTTVRAYAATIINGTRTKLFSKAITLSAPMYMRLARAGDLWTMKYSANSTNWTTAGTFSQAFTPTEAGPYAGNNGSSPPPHTAVLNNFIVNGIPPQ